MNLFRLMLACLTLVIGVSLGVGISHLLERPTYKGPPVAGFTTGGMSCSPICGHRQ